MKPTTNPEKVVKQLIYSRSVKNPIYSAELESQTGLSGRQVRKIVEELRINGHRIVSCNRGYYRERNYNRYVDSIEHLKRHAKAQLKNYKLAVENAK